MLLVGPTSGGSNSGRATSRPIPCIEVLWIIPLLVCSMNHGYTGTPGYEHRFECSYTSATGENGPGCLLFPNRTAIRQRLPTRTTSRLYLQHKLSSGVPIERAPLTLATMYLYTDAGQVTLA